MNRERERMTSVDDWRSYHKLRTLSGTEHNVRDEDVFYILRLPLRAVAQR